MGFYRVLVNCQNSKLHYRAAVMEENIKTRTRTFLRLKEGERRGEGGGGVKVKSERTWSI